MISGRSTSGNRSTTQPTNEREGAQQRASRTTVYVSERAPYTFQREQLCSHCKLFYLYKLLSSTATGPAKTALVVIKNKFTWLIMLLCKLLTSNNRSSCSKLESVRGIQRMCVLPNPPSQK